MSLLNNTLLLDATAGGGGGGYQISRSLRFNSPDSAYLSRTPASAGNRTTWTWSGWVKRAALSATQGGLFGARDSTSSYFQLYYPSGDALRVIWYDTSQKFADTAAVFRDPSAWYHVVLAVDTTQGTAADRIKIYVNNVQQTLSGNTVSSSYSTLVNNSGSSHVIGRYAADQDTYLSAYLADIHFIDGQALNPTSFGEFDATTGVWMPKAYSGTYGTNGFHLPFSDNSTAAALGTDTSGQGNTWTVNNISVAAGADNDSLVDVPTNGSEVDTGVGGEVRGNYATWNPNNFTSAFFSDGNLKFNPTSGYNETAKATMAIGNKCYFEVTILSPNTAQDYLAIGLMRQETQVLAGPTTGYNISVGASGNYTGSVAYFPYSGVVKYNGSDVVSGLATGAVGDVVGISYDPSNGQVKVYKNGTALNSGNAVYTLSTSYSYVPAMTEAANNAYYVNFGQRPFAYTAPSGFKALCTANLPAPVVTKPSTVMDVVLYTGTGSALTPTSTLGFNPDLVWIKGRSGATDHAWYDSVRGVEKRLESNTADAEVTSDGGVTAFNSAGFSVGTLAQVNTSSATYAAWCWDAGSSTVTNTQGSISSQVRANATAGFSIVTYTGNLTGNGTSTVGHGLGVAPSLVITKRHDGTSNWCAQHISTSSASQILFLDTTDAQYSVSTYGTLSRPTSSVFSVNYTTGLGINGQTHVAYCFAPVAGYSSFGSYIGNGSTDGPFIYTGFRPRWVMIKSSTTAGTNWLIVDAARDTYNAVFTDIQANTSNPENQSQPTMDFTSDGFKLRNVSSNANGSSATFVYAAFAENPFSIARAR